MKKFNEPTSLQVVASYKSQRNTALARQLYAVLSWGTYDRCQAHTWALRMINADPQNGEDCAVALINADYMIPGARKDYNTNNRGRKIKCDKALDIYLTWKAEIETQEAA